MTFLRAVTHVEAPPERVWRLLADWERQAAWMVDASEVRVTGEVREGPGTCIVARTNVAGVEIDDPMVVTRWEPGRLIEVLHVGWPIRGIAWFGVDPTPYGARFEWAEELDPPLGPLGEVGGTFLRPAIERLLRRSVARLKRLAESGS